MRKIIRYAQETEKTQQENKPLITEQDVEQIEKVKDEQIEKTPEVNTQQAEKLVEEKVKQNLPEFLNKFFTSGKINALDALGNQQKVFELFKSSPEFTQMIQQVEKDPEVVDLAKSMQKTAQIQSMIGSAIFSYFMSKFDFGQVLKYAFFAIIGYFLFKFLSDATGINLDSIKNIFSTGDNKQQTGLLGGLEKTKGFLGDLLQKGSGLIGNIFKGSSINRKAGVKDILLDQAKKMIKENALKLKLTPEIVSHILNASSLEQAYNIVSKHYEELAKQLKQKGLQPEKFKFDKLFAAMPKLNSEQIIQQVKQKVKAEIILETLEKKGISKNTLQNVRNKLK